jgi:predicted transcriptional regulator
MEDRVFSPRFIPYFLNLENEPYNFNSTTIKIYGFIIFYLRYTNAPEFYFTNEQIGKMLNIYPSKVQPALKTLTESKLIYRFTKFNPKNKKRIRFIEVNSNTYAFITRGDITQKGLDDLTQKGSNNENINKIINKENKEQITEKELFEFLNGNTKSDKLPELPF